MMISRDSSSVPAAVNRHRFHTASSLMRTTRAPRAASRIDSTSPTAAIAPNVGMVTGPKRARCGCILGKNTWDTLVVRDDTALSRWYPRRTLHEVAGLVGRVRCCLRTQQVCAAQTLSGRCAGRDSAVPRKTDGDILKRSRQRPGHGVA